jgi:hypothetical protein
MTAGIAPHAGIEPSGDFTEDSSIAGVKTAGAMARINRGYSTSRSSLSQGCSIHSNPV